jgi:hypothetical protein
MNDWNSWVNSSERKACQQKIDAILEEPSKITPYEYEFLSVNVDTALTGLEFSVEGE